MFLQRTFRNSEMICTLNVIAAGPVNQRQQHLVFALS